MRHRPLVIGKWRGSPACPAKKPGANGRTAINSSRADLTTPGNPSRRRAALVSDLVRDMMWSVSRGAGAPVLVGRGGGAGRAECCLGKGQEGPVDDGAYRR